ncbi:MAG: ATP-binding protein [Salinispira sp.]
MNNSLETFLCQLDLFKDLNVDEIKAISPEFISLNSIQDDVILSENTPATSLYIIRSGSVNIWKNFNSSTAVLIGTQTAGHVFGELAIIDNQDRSATVVAREESQFLIMHKKDFFSLCDKHPKIMFSVVKNLSTTLRAANNIFIANLTEQNEELQSILHTLRTTQGELVQAQLFAKLGKLSSLIIHDIKNPLSIIKSYSEIIQSVHNKPEHVKDYAKKITNAAERLNQLTQELLDYTRGEIKLHRVFTSLPILFQKIEDSLQKNCQDRNIIFNRSYEGSNTLHLDENRIIRAIHNICDNALKAMTKDDTLTLRGEISADRISITINDTGHGMGKITLNRIFEPFYSLSKGGTGLGMLSVKNIMTAHDGSIDVQSEPDIGTTVTLSFPRSALGLDAQGSVPHPSGSAQRSTLGLDAPHPPRSGELPE